MESLDPQLQKLFSQAFILGGSPCSGKSTIAEQLASQFDLPYYKVDDHDQTHLQRCQPERHPVMCRYARMSWDQIWSRSPDLQVQEELDFYHERFDLILQDLHRYDLERRVLMEGAALLPELVNRCGVPPGQVVYLVPTPEFQRHHYSQRPWIQHILAECRDPAQAFENWMERDYLFGLEVLRQAQAHHYPTYLVDGSLGIEDRLEQVRRCFGLPSV